MPGIQSAAVVDVHAHVRLDAKTGAAGVHGPEFGVDETGRPWYRVGNYRLEGVRHTTSPFTDPELRIKRMDAAGIDFQVLSPSPLTYFHHIEASTAIDFCRRWNDALSEVIKRFPERLAGLATLPMQDPVAAREELQRAIRDLKLWGAAMGTEFAEPLHSPALDRFYETLSQLDVPLFLHPAPAGIDGPPGDPNLKRFDLDVVIGFAAQESIAISTMIFGGVLDRHPKLDVWISHGGGGIAFLAGRLSQAGKKRPWASEAMKKDGAFEAALSRFWFDTHLNDDRALDLLTRVVGTERLVFGTNFAGWDQPDETHHAPPANYAVNARRLLRQHESPVQSRE